MGAGITSAGRGARLRHVLHHQVAWLESSNQQRPLIADEGTDPVALAQGVCRGTRTSFLPESEIHTSNDFLLFEEVLKCLLHLAIEQHVAVDLNALLLAQVLRFTQRGRLCRKVAFNGVTELPINPLF